MAKASKKEDKTKKPVVAKTSKKTQTVRERTQVEANKPRRVRKTARKVATPFKSANAYRKRRFTGVPLPDNRLGRLLSKRVRIVPRFVTGSWQEIRQVTWPSFRETVSLTFAVFIFALVFALIVGFLDYGLGKLFKEVIIK